MSLLTDRRKRGPYGLFGGDDGKPGTAAIIRDGNARSIGSKGSWDLETGDRVRIETPGGGGFGK
jgi:N-methylhydantoinase B